ncbi:glycosyltransferase family 4 protein [Sneathiella chinensis]|uniref:Glycosyl transferase n=1 Tax=Sneathiella chinensis TaxID=349750 RepID=A0ABQ5U6Z1_9PROT|nr:glycosyltransferase family 4 protein [Sneathiella chinensis]GLQ07922.1 glycosyl transferase [Sneathiella chinensis]
MNQRKALQTEQCRVNRPLAPDKILFVSKYDPTTARHWSGTPHYFWLHLEKHVGGPVHVCRPTSLGWFRLVSKVVRRLAALTGKTGVNLTRSRFYARRIGAEVQREIERVEPAIVVGVAASIELAGVTTDVPIIHMTDATFAAVVGFYPEFSGLWKWLEKQGEDIEKAVIDKAAAVVCTSRWASDSVVRDYRANPAKVHTILQGPNIEKVPALSERDLARKFGGTCRILFVGRDWNRKGGDFLLEVFACLRAAGLNAELTIVGCRDPKIPDSSQITVLEDINKDEASERRLFDRVFGEASFFVLPTRAEAFGVVYAEAAAYATPSVAPDIGGVGSVIKDGKTGVLMPEDASPEQYADRILALWEDKETLFRMSRQARHFFETDLNWDHFTREFLTVVDQVTDDHD